MQRVRWPLCPLLLLGCVALPALAGMVPGASLPEASSGREFPFELSSSGEGVAEITAAATGASWGRKGAEASVAIVSLDGQYNQDIVIDHGAEPWQYSIFLGPVKAGRHSMRIERNAAWSAAGAGLEIRDVHARVVAAGDPEFTALSHAPVLYARADTVGHFSDVPLLMWYEVFPDAAGVEATGAGETLQYSFIFTNEDAGTPTPALMARWGRGTDIEYAYRVHLDSRGQTTSETFQGFRHDDVDFHGKHLGQHPYLLVATPNNVFADTGASILQYRLLPERADLSHHSREEVMDQHPWIYRIMAEELQREGKIRPFGERAENAAGDPRSYLYFEIDAENHGSGLAAWVKLKDHPGWYSSYLGYPELAVSRSGWFRTTVELPPGTPAEAIEFVGIECLDVRDPWTREHASLSAQPESTLRSISKVFLLDTNYQPGKNLLDVHPGIKLHPGEFYTLGVLTHK